MKRVSPAIARLLSRTAPERKLGPFELVRPLGQGGFAPVWLARERYAATDLRTAAVKLFSLEGLVADRAISEARALCRVEHPSVVRFYALSIDEAAGVMGLAMEHLDGAALDVRIAEQGRLSVMATLRAGAMIASALSAVHRAGLAHGDVKPANIVETPAGPRLIDFGIAAAEDASLRGAAREAPPGDDDTERLLGRAIGTPGYVDPHAVRAGEPPCVAGDLYGLGATLYACLTGRAPAAQAPGGALDRAVIEGRAAPLDLMALRPDVPPDLAALVTAMLAPDRAARPRSAEIVAARLEGLRRGLGAKRELPPEAVGPFRGLGRFEARDRDVFFGRSGEIAAALEALRSRGLVALVGPSGSGKSSLARAGLLPAIESGALADWPPRWDAALIEPGRDPSEALALALAPFVPGVAAMDAAAIALALAARAEGLGRGVVLCVDPLEALASPGLAPGGAALAELLTELGAKPIPGVRAVVAARRDRLEPLLAMKGLGPVLARAMLLVAPLDAAAQREGVALSLEAFDYAFEDDALKEEIFDEMDATAGAMPLCCFALAELWRKRDTGAKRLTRAALRAIGGIAGALERHAEATLASLDPGARAAAPAALLALTTPEGTRASRNKEELRALGDGALPAIAAFEAARLVVPAGEEGNGVPRRVTLAHEALIVQWPRLGRWVREAQSDRLLAEEIEADAARRSREPDGAALWQARRLSNAIDLMDRGTVHLTGRAAAFLRASRRAERRARIGIAAAAIAILLSLAGAAFLYVRAAQAERAAARAEEAAAQAKEAAARQALLAEQEKLRLAEKEQRALQEKERTIAKLTEDLTHARTSEEATSKLQELRTLLGGARRRSAAGERPAPADPPPSAPVAAAASAAAILPAAGATAKPAPAKPFGTADDWQ